MVKAIYLGQWINKDSETFFSAAEPRMSRESAFHTLRHHRSADLCNNNASFSPNKIPNSTTVFWAPFFATTDPQKAASSELTFGQENINSKVHTCQSQRHKNKRQQHNSNNNKIVSEGITASSEVTSVAMTQWTSGSLSLLPEYVFRGKGCSMKLLHGRASESSSELDHDYWSQSLMFSVHGLMLSLFFYDYVSQKFDTKCFALWKLGISWRDTPLTKDVTDTVVA